MNRFTVDFSSSPASERLPSITTQQRRPNIFSLPEDVASTTPAAPPPSQLFQTSQPGTGVSKLDLNREPHSSKRSAPGPNFTQTNTHSNGGLARNHLFEASTNTYATDDSEQDHVDEMMEDEDETEDMTGFERKRNTAPSLMKFSTNSMSQSLRRSTNRKRDYPSRSRLPWKGRPHIVPGLAKEISRRLGIARLAEPDEIILGTEELIRGMDEECQECDSEGTIQAVVTSVVPRLIAQWRNQPKHRPSSQNTIGPDPSSTAFEKAQYLADILLDLHHPGSDGDGADSLVFARGRNQESRPMPANLLRILDNYHINYAPLFDQVLSTTPAPSANELYWDAIETFTLRGKFEEVMELLRRGDLNHAVIDTPEGTKSANFSGTQLQQAEDAVYRARQLINTCPAFQHGDWDLEGQDWDVYRKQLQAEIEHLADQVTSHEESISRPHEFGLFGRAADRSGLPFIIYQRLKTVYSIMIGDAQEIMGLAQDWVEASILLTVWWIPTDEQNVAQWSFDVSRADNPTHQDVNPYLYRLSEAFLCVTDPDSQSGFQLNTVDPVEVCLGAILQGDTQSCLRILQCLSLCIASTVAEIGTAAGWLASTQPSVGLDQDDLMVLNYGAGNGDVEKDDILQTYADALFARDVLRDFDGREIEGWELAFSVLSRLHNQERLHKLISEMLQRLPVDDQERAAKLVEICEQFGLEAEGRKVSESFADSLINNTTEYGTALLCYARAHAEHKVRQVVDLLNSYCLVQSKSYPPEEQLDSALAQLVGSPKSALQNIADADSQAAEILQFYLVGYACLRRFYSLRDNHATKTVHLRPIAKKKAAAKVLIAAINSAADSIYGGLYDPNRQSAIQVDGLLTLLGEATIFLPQGDNGCILSSEQMYALLAAIEDLQSVSDRVYRATEECMEAALRNYHGSLPPSPHTMLKKSVSSGTNSNFSFSMMGSEMLARSEDSFGGKSVGSAVVIGQNEKDGTHRAWDWRARFKDSGTTGADVLKHLRMGLAAALSMATIENGGITA